MMLVKQNISKIEENIGNAKDKCLSEPYVLKGTCTVLWRGKGSNSLALSDKMSAKKMQEYF